ncbi:hypothetical protein ABD76_16605 [Paenibacillus dendritiformis]|nr:hypothetical protein [Paenibacillus dendritiformis]
MKLFQLDSLFFNHYKIKDRLTDEARYSNFQITAFPRAVTIEAVTQDRFAGRRHRSSDCRSLLRPIRGLP